MATIKTIQILLGVEPDDVWGPISQQSLNAQISVTEKSNPILIRIENELGTNPDGIWGPIDQAKLNSIIGALNYSGYKASSFADPEDVKSFLHCKSEGKSDQTCFAVGDNGIGQFGKNTAQDTIPMVAVHHDDMVAKWGSVQGAAHRPVEVTVNGKTFNATVEDRIGVKGRIDLNPACAKLAGLQPPFVVFCSWKWLT